MKWAEENGKRKSPLASIAHGDTVPSFPVVLFSFYSNVFFSFFFLVACVQNWVSHILSKYISQKYMIQNVIRKARKLKFELAFLCGTRSRLQHVTGNYISVQQS